MTVDYDAPRRSQVEPEDESLADLGRGNAKGSTALDVDDDDARDSFELPDMDLSGEELTIRVVPKQADEFTCTSCFLVHHRSRLADAGNGRLLCTDCA
jgi:hypothetical protein